MKKMAIVFVLVAGTILAQGPRAFGPGPGPMGFGGKTTLLGTKIGVLNRLPASFFVSVSYMCWAYRRHGAELASNGEIRRWLY